MDSKLKNNNATKATKKPRNHLRFKFRLLINIFLLAVSILLFIYSIVMSFSITKNEVITYTEKSDIDYKVYLKQNEFYETPYLKKGMVYIANLIDKIQINYNYNFVVSKNSEIDVTNKIVAKLIIASQSNSNIFYEKEYDLTPEAIDTMNNTNTYTLSKDIDIDYAYYNNLANKFKSNYAVNTTSYLEVYLKVTENSKETNSYILRNNSKTILTIPLSEQEINIGLNNQNINDEKQIVQESKFLVKDFRFIILAIISIILVVIETIKLVKKLIFISKKRTSNYDKFIKRILRGYDRIIVNVETVPNLNKYNIIKVANIQELIDVRDNVKEPINYYIVEEHQEAKFFVINNDDLYLYIVKSIDLDGDTNNEDKEQKELTK